MNSIGSSFNRTVLALLFVALAIGCSSARLRPTDGLLSRLRNRGPVALSSDNPYLAANLLVAREMEASPEVRGFIQHRGAPAALEVDSAFFAPLLMHFYYPENREEFELEDLNGTWAIRGPKVMEREKMKEVALLTRNSSGEPKLAFNTTIPPISRQQPTPGAFPGRPEKPRGQADDPFLASLEGKDRPFFSPGGTPEGRTQPERLLSPDQNKEIVEDLLRISGPHPAETTPRGDVVHYVTYPGETLSMIARWYTFDRANAERIARINRLANPNSLNIGDSIVVPAYLTRNTSRLTEEAVRALTQRN